MKLLKGLTLSICFHVILVALIGLSESQIKTKNEVVEISFESTKPEPQKNKQIKQVVKQAETPEKLPEDKSDDPLNFFSEKTQRVKKQMQAQHTGATQNRSLENLLPSSKPSREKNKPLKNDPNEAAVTKLEPKKQLSSFAPLFAEKGLSTIGDSLPKEVELGSFTALNSDRYLFYSFFSRVDDLIRFRWETMVSQAIERTAAESFLNLNRSVWVTEVKFILNPNGELKSFHILRESGIPGFDRAAVQAFVQARIFPNPPKEMINDEGVIELKYGFQVRYSPQIVAKKK